MNISIVGGTTVIWSGSVDEFYGQDKIGMGIFAPDANLDYDFTVLMSSGANDDYQGEETVFDLTLGFWGELSSTPTPTSTSESGGGDAGGEVLGTGVSASTCNDTAPTSVPTITNITPGTNSATLNWSPAGDPVSYYLIAYGTSPEQYLYGANVGMTTSYTVNNLSGGTTYYFVVRAGNGCTPGTFSVEASATPGGIPVAGPATGFAEGVLGEATESANLQQTGESETGDIKGEQTVSCTNATWWWMVPLVFGLYSIVLALLGERLPRRVRLVLHAVISILTAVVLIYAFCIWWYAVLLAIVVSAISFLFIKKTNK
jgi:hypothetical protein